MDIIRNIGTVVVMLLMAVFLQCSTSVGTPLRRRSVSMNPSGLSASDGLLKDLMFYTSDGDNDEKLSSVEIAHFYQNIAGYPEYSSHLLGDTFVLHGDNDGDQLLDESELLNWLGVVGTIWTRRR